MTNNVLAFLTLVAIFLFVTPLFIARSNSHFTKEYINSFKALLLISIIVIVSVFVVNALFWSLIVLFGA